MVFDGVVAKRFALAIEVPSQFGEHLVVAEEALFEVLPLLGAQPIVGIPKNQSIKLGRQQQQCLEPLHNGIANPRLSRGQRGQALWLHDPVPKGWGEGMGLSAMGSLLAHLDTQTHFSGITDNGLGLPKTVLCGALVFDVIGPDLGPVLNKS